MSLTSRKKEQTPGDKKTIFYIFLDYTVYSFYNVSDSRNMFQRSTVPQQHILLKMDKMYDV